MNDLAYRPGPVSAVPHQDRGTIAIIYNTALHVHRARRNLIRKLQSLGHDVVLISPHDSAVPEIEAMGVTHVPIRMTQYGMNPFAETRALWEMRRAIRKHRPIVCLCYTIKPNTLGTLAARSLDVPTINNVAGSGRAFSSGSAWKRAFFRRLLAASLRQSPCVFFQNEDDRTYFVDHGLVRQDTAHRIPGSGVDLESFRFDPKLPAVPTFLFASRLLREKGADQFMAAARRINATSRRAAFVLAGERLDDPGYVDTAEIQAFCATSGCRYIGVVTPREIPDLVRHSSFVVLPSLYGEGVPRILLEACAIGRPVITTESIGCKDVLRHGQNGFAVDPRTPGDLHDVIDKALRLDRASVARMGRSGRRLVERQFSEAIVLDAYLRAITAHASPPPTTQTHHIPKGRE